MAYGFSTNNVGRKSILIFDFGGGTFDVSILTIKDKEIIVRATAGDTHLGGEDFDNRMVAHFVDEFKRKFNRDISQDKGLLRNLKTSCERAKRVLSIETQTNITLEGTNLVSTITRARFEDLNEDLFQKSIDLVDKALRDAGLTKTDIEDVVLVGGSSRIPRVIDLVKEYFDGKELNKTINPDECVAYGAAVKAALLQDQLSTQMKGLMLSDVCPLSLGIELIDGSFSKIIGRNTPIPVERKKDFYTSFENQPWTAVEIFEGERPFARANHFLGHFALDNIPPGPKGTQIDVTFEIDANGILQATATEPKTGKSNQIVIVNRSRLSEDDANRAIEEAKRMTAEDNQHQKRSKIFNEIEEYCSQIKEDAEQLPNLDARENVLGKIEKILEWLRDNRYGSQQEMLIKKEELKEFWNRHRSS